jgi:acetylornithine deacetylase/succinyl-diaminopimelate desuccinylase-like protein
LEGVRATDADLRYEVEVINAREGYVVSPEHPYVQEVKRIIREVTGANLPFTGTLASTDMNYQVNPPDHRKVGDIGYITGGAGMPCVNFGVGGSYSRGHQQDESASIDEIVQCAKAVALIVMRKLG